MTNDEVMRMFQQNIGNLRELLFRVIPALPEKRDCPCATALDNARLEA